MKKYICTMMVLYPSIAAASSIVTFDAPGFATTCGTAIASDGTVAGTATAGTAATSKTFVYINGHFSHPKPDVPAGIITFAGINRQKAIVGGVLTSNPLGVGVFLYHAGHTSFPTVASGSVTSLDGVTDSGILLGAANFAPSGSLQFDTLAFTQTRAGKLTVLNDGSGFMEPSSLSGRGDRVVGLSVGAAGVNAWLYYAGHFSPLAVAGATLTWPHAVDDRGLVSGSFYTGSGSNAVAHGFVFADGKYRTWDVPGAAWTEIEAANESRQITGCFRDSMGTHGFIATP